MYKESCYLCALLLLETPALNKLLTYLLTYDLLSAVLGKCWTYHATQTNLVIWRRWLNIMHDS